MAARTLLAQILIVIAGCSAAEPLDRPSLPLATTPEEEFERIALDIESWYARESPILLMSSTRFIPVDQLNRLTELGCTSPLLYDRLIDLATHTSAGDLPRFDHDSPCMLGEEYSLRLVSRLLQENAPQKRYVLLLALRHHARHLHALQASTQPYQESVPGRLSQAYDSIPEGERWQILHIQAAYAPFVREVLAECFSMAADDGETNSHRAHLLGALFREAFPKARPEARDQMLHWVCDLIRARCTEAVANFIDYAVDYLPPSRLLAPPEIRLCESTLEQVARTALRADSRCRALRALAGLGSEHVLPLAELLLGEDPSEELVGRVYGALAEFPSKLDSFYSKTRHTLFRAYTDSRRVRSMTGDSRDQLTRRLLGWLREDPDSRVRQVALHGLIVEIEEAIRSRRGNYEVIVERAHEVLDQVLRDSSADVRRLAANYLSSYTAHLGFLDSDTREKIDKIFESVRR